MLCAMPCCPLSQWSGCNWVPCWAARSLPRLSSACGVGTFLVGSIFARDYSVVQAFTVIIALIFVTVNLVVDASYAYRSARSSAIMEHHMKFDDTLDAEAYAQEPTVSGTTRCGTC